MATLPRTPPWTAKVASEEKIAEWKMHQALNDLFFIIVVIAVIWGLANGTQRLIYWLKKPGKRNNEEDVKWRR